MANEYCICPSKLASIQGNGPTLVTFKSPFHHRNAVERCAWHFKREFSFDFCQFRANKKPGDERYIPYEAYLFHRSEDALLYEDAPTQMVVAGACCFYREKSWCLDWIWFHPYFRRRGILSKSWTLFVDRYDSFGLTEPLSVHMEMFLGRIRS